MALVGNSQQRDKEQDHASDTSGFTLGQGDDILRLRQSQASIASRVVPHSHECQGFTDFVFRRGDLYVEITTELGVFADAAVRLAVLGPAAEAIVAQRQRSRSHEEAVWLAAYELLLHAEVGMIGALSLDIALSQRLLIERLKAALLLRGPIKPHDISLFASLSANATIDTLRHMLYEVRRVRLITVALDNNLQSLLVIVDPGPTSSGAAPPPVNCRSFASVLRGARDLNALFDGYAPHLDAAERAQIQDAHPALLREFKMLQTDDSAIQHDFTEWRGCFRVFLGDQTLDVYDTLLQTRRFSDPRLFFHELASPFQLLTEYLKKRQEIREKCVEMCDNDISSLLSRSGDCIPTAELRSQLRRYEDLGQLVLAGSVRQSEAIRSIEMLVQDANLHASVLFAAPDDRISLEKMHDTFRRYDDLRVMCSRVVERSAQLLDAMAPHIVTLEKARDWL
ncbi:hypothetical protein ACG7TL_008850 [Trametes sanguinea]